MGGCHIEEGIREGNLNSLGGGEGVTRGALGRKGLQRTANAKDLRQKHAQLEEEAAWLRNRR